MGNNEEGARYSGINTDNMKIIAYVICSLMAGIAGLLFAFELDSVQPAQTGEFYELYAETLEWLIWKGQKPLRVIRKSDFDT